MIFVDGKKMKTPSSFTWGLEDISDSATGRTQDAVMHKNRIAQKRKLSFGWASPTAEEAADILKAFNPESVEIEYPDAMTGVDEKREFYVEDRSAPVKSWTLHGKRYDTISFDVSER